VLRKTLKLLAGSAVALPGIAAGAAHPVAWPAPDGAAHLHRIQLVGDVFVERFEPAPGGRIARVLERADRLHSGDRLVFVVSWNRADQGRFVVTNPVPPSVVWQPGGTDPTQEVSVDGGHTWGTLATLLVHDAAGWRSARPDDVTHVRWRVPPLRSGQITYRGIVR
jgi:hypothetical protein